MTGKIILSSIIFSVFFTVVPPHRVTAQTSASGGLVSTTFDTSDFPQWAKDIRRWEIVAFGSFPFTMFTATFFMDTYRWASTTGMDWSDSGRRYAPWPFKSAGAVDMTNDQHKMVFAIAAGLSAAIAFSDLVIVQIKRSKERRRIENLPPGTAIIVRRPLDSPAAEGGGGEDADIQEPPASDTRDGSLP